jgi:valine--pyruvate aminotransferase
MRYSRYGERFARPSGILELMDDLGGALAAGGDVCMLGGGNPAHVPELSEGFRALGQQLTAAGDEWAACLGDYTAPRGEPRFLAALARGLRDRFGFDVGPEHLVLTAGSQASFYALFKLLGGQGADGHMRPVLLPRLPDYVGYAELGSGEADALLGIPALPQATTPGRFRYALDWARLEAVGEVGAVCVSNPGNPTGQLLTRREIDRLHDLARARSAPLIVDAAYGAPFPGLCFGEPEDIAPWWQPDSVLCLSLSKLGLPGVRAGVVVAPPELAAALTGFNACLTLAPGNLGPYLLRPWVEEGTLFEVGQRWLKPFYAERRERALAVIDATFATAGIDCRVHESGGGFFLWLWFPKLGRPAREVYASLKAAGVLVVPGEHFRPGLAETPDHLSQCLRVSYAGTPERFALGIERMAAVLAQHTGTRALACAGTAA